MWDEGRIVPRLPDANLTLAQSFSLSIIRLCYYRYYEHKTHIEKTHLNHY